MAKRALLMILGFGLITGGIVGITTAVVKEKHKALLREMETLQEKARLAALEEERNLQEKSRELDRREAALLDEKLRFQEERLAVEAAAREAERLAKEKALRTDRFRPPPPRDMAGDASSRRKEQPSSPKALEPSGSRSAKKSGSGRSVATGTARFRPEDPRIRWISRKASLEAARYYEPVEYYSSQTRHLVLAEPYGTTDGFMRVRVRVWKDDRLIKDSWMNVPLASFPERRYSRA